MPSVAAASAMGSAARFRYCSPATCPSQGDSLTGSGNMPAQGLPGRLGVTMRWTAFRKERICGQAKGLPRRMWKRASPISSSAGTSQRMTPPRRQALTMPPAIVPRPIPRAERARARGTTSISHGKRNGPGATAPGPRAAAAKAPAATTGTAVKGSSTAWSASQRRRR